MDLRGAEVEENLYIVLKLGASHNGIFTEQDPSALNQGSNGNQLHPGDEVPHGLILRHEASRPGGCVFNKRSYIRNLSFVGIADGMPDSRIRDPRQSFPNAALPQTGFDIWGDIDERTPCRHLKPELFAVAFHCGPPLDYHADADMLLFIQRLVICTSYPKNLKVDEIEFERNFRF